LCTKILNISNFSNIIFFSPEYDSSILRRALDEPPSDEPTSIGSAESSESSNNLQKSPKTEFVEEDEILNLSDSPIDYSISTDDTSSEVEKISKPNLESFQLFCHICLKMICPGLTNSQNRSKRKKSGKCDSIGFSQCFMCPRAIYCKTCIYSINHLKLHSGINIEIPINKTD